MIRIPEISAADHAGDLVDEGVERSDRGVLVALVESADGRIEFGVEGVGVAGRNFTVSGQVADNRRDRCRADRRLSPSKPPTSRCATCLRSFAGVRKRIDNLRLREALATQQATVATTTGRSRRSWIVTTMR